MFYNKVNPNDVNKYKPPQNVEKTLWKQAVQNNPDPKNLVVAQLVGFEDLKKRIQQQDFAHSEYQKKLEDIRRTIVEMQNQHELIKKQEIEKLRKVMTDQSHRLLKVMTKIECERARDMPLLNTEIDFRRKIESLKRKLAKPTQFQARLSDLSSLVRMQEDRPTGNNFVPNSDQVVFDPDTVEKLYDFLETQRGGLEHLTNTLKKDRNDIAKVLDGLET